MHRLTLLAVALLALACDKGQTGIIKLPDGTPPPVDQARDLPPVALNAQTPVEYPPALFDQGIEGTVILRLYADTAGVLAIRFDTRAQESERRRSIPLLHAAPNLRFAPARHDGRAVAASFLQPIYFRHPGAGGATP